MALANNLRHFAKKPHPNWCTPAKSIAMQNERIVPPYVQHELFDWIEVNALLNGKGVCATYTRTQLDRVISASRMQNCPSTCFKAFRAGELDPTTLSLLAFDSGLVKDNGFMRI
jgi:hypothetical protein